MPPQDYSRGLLRPSLLLVAVSGISVLTCLALIAFHIQATQGGLGYDDASYLENALRWAANILAGEKPINSSGRPPFLTLWLTLCALPMRPPSITALAYLGTLVPYLLTAASILFCGRVLKLGSWTCVAILLYCAAPGVLYLGKSILVETFLSLWVLLTLLSATRALIRPDGRSYFLVGCTAGLAFMTKFSALTLLAGPLLYFVFYTLKPSGPPRAGRSLLWFSLVGLLLTCGPWYLRYFEAAYQHAAYAARFDQVGLGIPDSGFRPFRIVDGMVATFGVVGSLLLATATGWWIRQKTKQDLRDQTPATGHFLSLSFLAVVLHACALCFPSYYDTRFFVPAAPVLTVAMACLVKQLSFPEKYRILLPAAGTAVILLFFSATVMKSIVQTKEAIGPSVLWRDASPLLEELARKYRVRSISNVGHDSRWNAAKLGMLAQIRLGSRKLKISETAQFDESRAWEQLKRDDAILVLQEQEIDPGFLAQAPAQNASYRTIRDHIPPGFEQLDLTRKPWQLPRLKVFVQRQLLEKAPL